MGEVPLVSQAERSPSARGTEALQSCFAAPGCLASGQEEGDHRDRLPVGAALASGCCRPPRATGILPLAKKKAKKKAKENRGGDVTPMRLQRSLFFVAPATPAGRLSRRKPGETVKALPGRPSRAGSGVPSAPSCPGLHVSPRGEAKYVRVTRHESRNTAFTHRARQASATKSWRSYRVLPPSDGEICRLGPDASRARLGSKSGVFMAVRYPVGAKGSHHQKPPPGPPLPPPRRGFPARVRAAWRRFLAAPSRLACPRWRGMARGGCP